MYPILYNFQNIRPLHEIDQEKILTWIAQVHAKAEQPHNPEPFFQEIFQKILKLGLGKEKIQNRGIQISDLFQEDWSQMEIYPLTEHPHGVGFAQKSDFFDREVSHIFEQFYPENASFPSHLIHVTCTGYVAPSPAQKIVSLRGMGTQTVVTHAYHMGCYASIPAIRMGIGFATPLSPNVDIIHTEICSIHLHPLKHTSEQLLVQSLFGDGFIKYSIGKEKTDQPHLKILTVKEETLSESTQCMTWRCEDKGLSMSLSREIPVRIARAIEEYLSRLFGQLGLTREEGIKKAYFAIHPGGPKILQQIKERIGLESFQLHHSEDVLLSYGNMSSATLPHIWERMVLDPQVKKGSLIVSLAFGPGLTMAGAIFEKG